MELKNILANQLHNALITDARDDGTHFTRLADNSPRWMADAVHAAHGGMYPDDIKYEMIDEVAGGLSDMEADTWDELHELCDGLVTIWNIDRAKWLASHLGRAEYVNEAAQEYGIDSEGFDIFAVLGQGIYREYEEIANELVNAIGQRAGELDEDPLYALCVQSDTLPEQWTLLRTDESEDSTTYVYGGRLVGVELTEVKVVVGASGEVEVEYQHL